MATARLRRCMARPRTQPVRSRAFPGRPARVSLGGVLALGIGAAPLAAAPPEISLDAPWLAIPALPFAQDLQVADFDADGTGDLLFLSSQGFRAALGRSGFRYDPGPDVAVPQLFAATVADLNQDGRPDVVVTRTTNRLGVFLGQADGTFRAGTEMATGVTPQAVRAVRLDGDAFPELVIANFGAQSVSVFHNRGDGTFDTRQDWTVPGYPSAVEAADLNGDGIADLVAALRGTGTLAWLLRDGGSLLGGTSFATPTLPDPRGLVVCDLDADRRPDVIVVAMQSSTCDRFWNQNGTLVRSPASLTPFTRWTFGDVTGDGRPDFVCVLADRPEIAVLRGLPGGEFARGMGGVPPAAPSAIALLDGDGDGRLDVAGVTGDPAAAVLLRGAGDGSFGVRRDLEVAAPEAVAAGDLNGDGRTDLAACSSAAPELVAFLRSAAGGYTLRRSALPAVPSALLMRELDGDAIPDAAVSLAGSRVGILHGEGDGTFAAGPEIAVGLDPMGLAALDVTGDHLLDLMVACRGSQSAMVLQGLGGGQFVNASRPSFLAGELPAGAALGALNPDGKVDLAVADEGSNTVRVLLGLGDGAFRPTVEIPAGGSPRGVVITDLNQDRDADLVIPNWAPGTLTLVMGDPTGRYTDSRTLQGFDRPSEVLPADLNNDRKTDLVVVQEHGVAVCVQVARGFFFPTVEYPVDGATSGALGDLNDDGWPDLAVVQAAHGQVAVLEGDGTGRFGAPRTFTVGSGPVAAAIGELNGDAKTDLVVADGQDGTVAVLFGAGDGFEPPVFLSTPPGPTRIALLDVNADARLDLVVATPSGALCVYPNLGHGAFGPRVTTAIENAMQSLVSGDVDGDGRTDLVLAHRLAEGIVSIVYGRPGGFTPARPQPTGPGPAGVASFDLNGDGRMDFVAANSSGRSVSVALAAAGGWFEDSHEVPCGPGPVAVAICDLNLDGHPDLAVANSDSNTASVLLGRGDGTFESHRDFACVAFPTAITCGDLNRDGWPDLAVASRRVGVVSMLSGMGGGRFGLRTDYGSGAGTSGLLIVDADGDGTPDVVTANALGNTLSILRNRAGEVPVALSAVTAEALGAGVRVRWRWEGSGDAGAVVFVQTASGAAGPWQDADGVPAVAAALQECVVPGALQPWYRAALQLPDGARTVSAAVRLQAPVQNRGSLQLDPIAVVYGEPCTIGYRLAAAGTVVLDVFDVRGRRVERLASGRQAAGSHFVRWNPGLARGGPMPRGVYIVRLQSGGAACSRRLVIANRAGGS